MIYSKNLTNRDLMQNAMPLVSLSRKQWSLLLKHAENIECTEGSSELFKAIETLIDNQSRLEVIGGYVAFYKDTLDEPVSEKAVRL